MESKKIIYCKRCIGEIESKEDLIIVFNFLQIVPYHNECFGQVLKSSETIFVDNRPINGTIGNVYALVSAILGILTLFIPRIRYLSFFFFLYVLIRIYAWYQYERHL